MKRTLLIGFRGTSAQDLLTYCTMEPLVCENNKLICAEQIENAVKSHDYNHIFCFGQRPNIKNKIHIETQAQMENAVLKTEFDCETLMEIFLQNKITAILSNNAGTSYCNHIYYKGLNANSDKSTKIVFIHIPFKKNISDFNLFCKRTMKAILDFTEM